VVEGFGHSFAPMAANASGENIDLRADITDFFSHHLVDRKS